MAHRILTCKNHPNLRWSCKEEAWSGYYNGSRNIFFNGEPDGRGMYSDGSGLHCSTFIEGHDGTPSRIVSECSCPASDLILAEEDKLVIGRWNGWKWTQEHGYIKTDPN